MALDGSLTVKKYYNPEDIIEQFDEDLFGRYSRALSSIDEELQPGEKYKRAVEMLDDQDQIAFNVTERLLITGTPSAEQYHKAVRQAFARKLDTERASSEFEAIRRKLGTAPTPTINGTPRPAIRPAALTPSAEVETSPTPVETTEMPVFRTVRKKPEAPKPTVQETPAVAIETPVETAQTETQKKPTHIPSFMQKGNGPALIQQPGPKVTQQMPKEIVAEKPTTLADYYTPASESELSEFKEMLLKANKKLSEQGNAVTGAIDLSAQALQNTIRHIRNLDQDIIAQIIDKDPNAFAIMCLKGHMASNKVAPVESTVAAAKPEQTEQPVAAQPTPIVAPARPRKADTRTTARSLSNRIIPSKLMRGVAASVVLAVGLSATALNNETTQERDVRTAFNTAAVTVMPLPDLAQTPAVAEVKTSPLAEADSTTSAAEAPVTTADAVAVTETAAPEAAPQEPQYDKNSGIIYADLLDTPAAKPTTPEVTKVAVAQDAVNSEATAVTRQAESPVTSLTPAANAPKEPVLDSGVIVADLMPEVTRDVPTVAPKPTPAPTKTEVAPAVKATETTNLKPLVDQQASRLGFAQEQPAATITKTPMTMNNIVERVTDFYIQNNASMDKAMQGYLKKIEVGMAQNIKGHAQMGAQDVKVKLLKTFGTNVAGPLAFEINTAILAHDGKIDTKAERLAQKEEKNWHAIEATFSQVQPAFKPNF